jgi:hypothetical protein
MHQSTYQCGKVFFYHSQRAQRRLVTLLGYHSVNRELSCKFFRFYCTQRKKGFR